MTHFGLDNLNSSAVIGDIVHHRKADGMHEMKE